MGTFSKSNPRIVKPQGGVPEILHGYLEADSQSFKAGEFVYLNSGAVTACPAAGGDVELMGIALKDATNVSSGNIEIPIEIVDSGDEVYIQVSDGSGNLEAWNTTAVAGQAYDVEVASNIVTLASDDTTNPKLILLGPIKDVNGDAIPYWARTKPIYSGWQAIGGIA